MLYVLHCCLLFAVLISSCPSFVNGQYLLDTMLRPGPRDPSLKSLATAVYHFTTDLHKKIIESDVDANVLCSPTSIYVAMAMLYAGSGGETKSQLASALHLWVFNSNDTEFYGSIKILLQTWNSAKKKYTLKMANRLFGQKGFRFKDEYLTKTKDYFLAELEALNFKKDPSRSRSKINSWVARMTSGKIKDLFPEDAIDSDTVLALANAVYFNASWLYKFEKHETKPQLFYTSKEEKIEVPMMHLLQYEGLRYTVSKDQSFRLLELPYTDKSVSMIIGLDDGKDDFDTLLRSRIIDSPWSEIVDVFTNVAIRLSLPKFHVQQSMDLKMYLEALGMKNLFGNADLSGIAGSGPLKLSDAYHKADVAIDELGTEAAAATGFGFAEASGILYNGKIIDFKVNRPFLFLVVEKKTGSILFLGHIKNPLKST